jgi:hypothetical protein
MASTVALPVAEYQDSLFRKTVRLLPDSPVASSKPPGGPMATITAGMSLVLWLGVAFGGRVVAFL